MKRKSIKTSLGRFAIVSLVALNSAAVMAENVFVTSFYGNTSADLTPAPISSSSGFYTIGATSASMSTATPSPGVSPRRIIFGHTPGATWSVQPTDATYGAMTFLSLQNIGVYKIYVTKGQSGNASTNIIVTMTASGGSLADTNGVGSSGIELDVFQRAKANHVWVHVGYITNDNANPTITFTHTGGAIDNNADATLLPGQRWYVDAVRFEYVDSCNGVAGQVGVAGPLAAGQTFVNVTGIASGATNVVVYENNSPIAETNSVAGFAGGTLTIATPALNQNSSITAKQIKNGCESLLASSGPIVGGGANPQLRAFLGVYKDGSLTGPVGANGASTATNYFLKASGLVAGFGTAFSGGETLPPGACWQTVSFSHDGDYNFTASGTSVAEFDAYAALSGVAFAIDAGDSGPYEIYVDQIMNGDVVIEDFESYSVGTTNSFSAPANASLPSPLSTYLTGYNSSVISDSNAFAGSKSCRIQWQWADNTDIRWAHVLLGASPTSGKYFPQVDTTQPITIRYLVLPVGVTTNNMSFPTAPASQTKAVGENVTFTVTPAGAGPFTYQWQFAGSDLSGETGSTLTKSNVQLSDAGVYSVVVNNSTGCSATLQATLTVSETPASPTLGFSVSGGQITLTWTGSFTLQSKATIDGTWTDVTSTSGHQEALNSSTTKFFRLRQ